jgi:two-component system, cell cycle response regulator
MDPLERARATRVLVVDDNAVVRRLTSARLRAVGYAVAEVVDGAAALEEFERTPFHVVITDVSMPRLDGLELLAVLRHRPLPPEVILLTGSGATDAQAAVQALRLGAHDYISKSPAALEAVVLAVERAAEKWRLREENSRLVRELRRASLVDSLTGVGNRRAFDEAIVQEVARARRLRSSLALVLVDLDRFKDINDTHGHRGGDDALAALGARLDAVVRSADRVFRYGGEEFAILLPNAALGDALTAAERIVAAVASVPITAGSVRLPLTCSAGVSLLRASDDPLGRDLITRADAALYESKRAGRNRATAFPADEITHVDTLTEGADAQEEAC